MAKMIVTFTDRPRRGVQLKTKFDPPLKMKNGKPQPTPAQVFGAAMMERVSEVFEKHGATVEKKRRARR